MAERPIFIPSHDSIRVQEISLSIQWHGGFAPVQKKKNIAELHGAARSIGISPILEISTKSETAFGQELSAFNLGLDLPLVGKVSIESAFQSSKVFEHGGPYIELLEKSPREARSDERLRSSGRIVEFRLQNIVIPSEPKTLFYDWLYIRALWNHPEWHSVLLEYSAFSDIEFNPQKSLNCQARSCALFVSLLQHNLVEDAISSPAKLAWMTENYTETAVRQ